MLEVSVIPQATPCATIRGLEGQRTHAAVRHRVFVTDSSLQGGTLIAGIASTALNESIGITRQLPVGQRAALEQLLFFNVNQHRVRVGIQQSIETYGVPEIHEEHGSLRVRVGDIAGVETLFAVCALGRPLGVAVFARLGPDRLVVLHLGVDPELSETLQINTRVLLKLMHEIRGAARHPLGVERIELVYKDPARQRA